RPSCTAIVWPIMSGMIVERRDHVLITFFELLLFWASTFFARWSSMNGPFFKLRGMLYSSLAALPRGVPTTDDHAVARLALAPRAALGLAIRVDRVAATGRLALATPRRGGARVHSPTAD